MRAKPNNPPRFAVRLLDFISGSEEKRTIAGDLVEFYCTEFEKRGRHRANLWFLWQIFKSAPSLLLNSIYWRVIMWGNYFKIMIRNLKLRKVYSLINIFGLAAGLACSFLILLWVWDELSYDRFFPEADSIYLAAQELNFSRQRQFTSTTPDVLAAALKSDFPEVELTSRFLNTGWSAQYDDKIFNALGSFADPDFLDIFSIQFLQGDHVNALSDPNSILLTRELAQSVFGDEDPLGKILKIDNAVDCRVTGLVKKLPKNSHLSFDYILPFSILESRGFPSGSWKQSPFINSYVKLRSRTDVRDFNLKIKDFISLHDPDSGSRLFLHSVTRIRLHALEGGGAIMYIYIFSAVAAFILLIACINFVNLSTAKSAGRAKEVGLRKVMGGERSELIRQFYGESQFMVLLAFIISLLLVRMLLPTFNQVSGKTLGWDDLFNFQILLMMLGFAALTGLFSGTYPALFLSGYQPVMVLKGRMAARTRGSFRKVLVTVQFTLSILLLICTLVVFKQLNYIQNKPLGFNRELLLSSRMAAGSPEYNAVKQELLQNPGVLDVTAVDRPPSYRSDSVSNLEWEGKAAGLSVNMQIRHVDYDFFKTFEMEMLQGRSFSPEFPSDRAGLVMNKTAAGRMGWEDPIGRRVSIEGEEFTVIGLVKDFHVQPFYSQIDPILIILRPERCLYVCVRIAPDKVSETMKLLESIWGRLDPGYLFEYEFLDERIDRRYRSEQRMGNLITYLTGLAVLISCLGLFGLSSFTAEQRTREIGIRKVLGASFFNIFSLLNREYLIWLVLANLLAWPLSFFIMRKWLLNFAYRTDLDAGVFLLSAGIALMTALLTVSRQSAKSALSDPVIALRNE